MTTAYRPSGEVLASHLDAETVLLHLGSKRYYRLNATAAVIWRLLETSPTGASALSDRLTTEFDVATEEAESAVRMHLEELTARSLIELVEETE